MNSKITADIDSLVKGQTKQPEIKAIPVWFHGYRFRSRLEGRWAVFFDHVGIEFQYEPQGFKLSDGTCYLPDFWLSNANSYAEVKPSEPSPAERSKCELTVLATGGTFLYLVGPPDFRSYTGVSLDSGFITEANYSLDIHSTFKAYYQERRFWANPDDDLLGEESCSTRYRDAVYAARGARFDGSDLPKPGHEPFNSSDRELGEGW